MADQQIIEKNLFMIVLLLSVPYFSYQMMLYNSSGIAKFAAIANERQTHLVNLSSVKAEKKSYEFIFSVSNQYFISVTFSFLKL